MFRPALVAAALVLPACSPSGDPRIEAEDAWARPATAAGQMSAAYVTIVNRGNGEDRLLGASSDVAERATLHRSSNEGGIARMRPVDDGLVIAPGTKVTLQPGGNHIMLEGVKRPLATGGTIRVTLRFERSGTQVVDAAVTNQPAMTSHEGH